MLSNNSSCPNCGRRFTQAENLISCPACQSLLPEKMVQISTPETALRYISLRSPGAFRDERILRSSLQDLLGRYFFQYRFVAELYKVAPRESAAFLEGNGCCDEEALRRSLCNTSASRENIDRYIDILSRSTGTQTDRSISVPTEKASQSSSSGELENWNTPEWVMQLMESECIAKAEEKAAKEILKDYSYKKLSDGTMSITKYKGSARKVTIPQYIEGCGVSVIDEAAFACSEIESVVIPNGIYSIKDHTFNGCKHLVSIQLPDTLHHLGKGAFGSTGSSIRPLLMLPASLTSIEGNPFISAKLTLRIAENHPCLKLVDGVLLNYRTQTLISYPYSTSSYAYSIPTGIKAIGEAALSSIRIVSELVIPDGVTRIGECAFISCLMTSVIIPETVTQIDNSAFSWCYSLRSVRVPGSVTVLPPFAFFLCINLTDVYLCDGISEIGSNAFADCRKLKSARIPASVTKINPSIFKNSPNVTVTVPKGSYAASFCEQNGIRHRYEGGVFGFLPRKKI